MPDCFQNENEKKKTELPEALIGSSPLPPANGEEGRKGGGGGGGARQSIFVSLHNQTESVKNNNEPIWVMFRELKKILL